MSLTVGLLTAAAVKASTLKLNHAFLAQRAQEVPTVTRVATGTASGKNTNPIVIAHSDNTLKINKETLVCPVSQSSSVDLKGQFGQILIDYANHTFPNTSFALSKSHPSAQLFTLSPGGLCPSYKFRTLPVSLTHLTGTAFIVNPTGRTVEAAIFLVDPNSLTQTPSNKPSLTIRQALSQQ